MLFDTHCHLDHDRFSDDFDAVLQRARDAGVSRITTIGCATSLESLQSALNIARQHDSWITATVGVHPHDASVVDDTLVTALADCAKDKLIVAIGETGLDYHYDHSPRQTQQHVFRQQIEIAKSLRKPLIIHTRNAAVDTLDILREENAGDVGGIIHCFSEDAAFAKSALDLGFVSSFSGIVTFKNAVSVHEAAKTLPLDAILVETDAPYLAPIPNRGKRNEPAFVADTVSHIAELRGIDVEALQIQTFLNAHRIFGLTPVAAP